MKLMNKKQAGFTLIELIIVIVILGILAVTAAPKFLDLQGDANASTLQGVKGALASSLAIVNGKAIIAGDQNNDADDSTAIEGINIDFGYPLATRADITAATDISLTAVSGTDDGSDFDWEADTTAGAENIIIYPVGGAANATCRVTYTQATGTTPTLTAAATVVATTTGC